MKIVVLVAAAATVSACAGPPPQLAMGPDPADPNAAVRPAGYSPVLAGTIDYRPVEPKPWAELNNSVAGGE